MHNVKCVYCEKQIFQAIRGSNTHWYHFTVPPSRNRQYVVPLDPAVNKDANRVVGSKYCFDATSEYHHRTAVPSGEPTAAGVEVDTEEELADLEAVLSGSVPGKDGPDEPAYVWVEVYTDDEGYPFVSVNSDSQRAIGIGTDPIPQMLNTSAFIKVRLSKKSLLEALTNQPYVEGEVVDAV